MGEAMACYKVVRKVLSEEEPTQFLTVFMA
jgi:hypothetical protein